MKNKLIISVIFLSLSITYFSCDEVTGPVSDVTGNVYGLNNVPLANLKVTIDDRSTYTSENGSFSIRNVNFPYDISVSDSIERHVTLFKGLTSTDVSLPVEYQTVTKYAYITVKFPEMIIQSDLFGKIIFTDGNYVNSYEYLNTFDTISNISVAINVPVTGRLIVLTYKRDANSKISSYENYGESSELMIEPGGIYSYQFDSLDLQLNPGEADVNGTFIIPAVTSPVNASFYLSFSGKKNYNYSSYSFSGIGLNTFNFKIPTGLPVQVSTIVENESFNSITGSSFSKFTVYPGLQNNLEVHLPPSIVSPAEGSVNVNINTQLSFDSGTGDGIFLIILRNTSRFVTYSIITTETNFTLKNLENLGFGRINNNSFYGYVRKEGPASSVNDYVTDFRNFKNNFTLRSGDRHFSTEP